MSLKLTFCRAGRRARTRLWNILWPKLSSKARRREPGKRQQISAATGKGVRGRSGRTVALGNAAMMQEMGLDIAEADASADTCGLRARRRCSSL
jgi:hypothetical protein